jgi:hypothetical protein
MMHRGEVGITCFPFLYYSSSPAHALKNPIKQAERSDFIQSFTQNKLKNYQPVQNNQKIFLRTAWQSTAWIEITIGLK